MGEVSFGSIDKRQGEIMGVKGLRKQSSQKLIRIAKALNRYPTVHSLEVKVSKNNRLL